MITPPTLSTCFMIILKSPIRREPKNFDIDIIWNPISLHKNKMTNNYTWNEVYDIMNTQCCHKYPHNNKHSHSIINKIFFSMGLTCRHPHCCSTKMPTKIIIICIIIKDTYGWETWIKPNSSFNTIHQECNLYLASKDKEDWKANPISKSIMHNIL